MAISKLQDLRATFFIRDRLPPSAGPGVHGVVLDVPQPGGLDTLAAYHDGSARYINQSGKTIIWEPSPGSQNPLRPLVDALLARAATVPVPARPLDWTPPSVEVSTMMATILTADGLIVVPLTGPPLTDALLPPGARLMQTMIGMVQPPKK